MGDFRLGQRGMIIGDSLNKFFDGVGRSLGFNGDAGGGVGDKAGEVELRRLIINKGTKPDPLDGALDEDFFSNQRFHLFL